jgi:succinate-semialdehyde dehydrogenase/glutarate-semialdehyde dehydrogenase
MNVIFKKFPTAALINGEWISSAKSFSVTDPATGAEIATVPDLGAKEAALAIDAASRALPGWSTKTAKERAAILRRWFDLITAETESLAQLMTTEQGKPLAEARAEVGYGASFIEWFAEEGKRAYGRTIPTTASSKRYITITQAFPLVCSIS